MSISYWFVMQSKYGIVPNRGTVKNFCVIFSLAARQGMSIIKEVGCPSAIDRHRQTPK